ncbi:nuclear transport factor 2 family protein [Methylocapsa acidiphila]|uniref:nuclear transport factor 2 family protein n=1 Tax=Methylocapsa acidiphila TaxID=133552 RepID=UPI0004255D4E|nr:nuclear transport factor 2 family protein [Methylocapsa acidiphila]
MKDLDAILAANSAYYQAFVGADFARMSGIWAEDEISCIHPGWPVLIGRKAVLDSYREILSNPMQEPIEHRDEKVMASGDEARVFCVEIVGGSALASTNWFRRVGGAWRLVHHQASPLAVFVEEPERPASGRLN